MQYTVDLVWKVDPVALYAAVLSTLIFCWELWKWYRRGPKLRGFVSSNMKIRDGAMVSSNMKFHGGPIKDDNTYLAFKVWNIGTEPTTISLVVLQGYKSWWRRLMKSQKPDFQAPQMVRGFPDPIPYELGVGKEFMTSGRQSEEIEERTREYRLYCAVYHSFGNNRPLLLRIKPIPPQNKTKAS
jgi:hypothetical protein